MADKLEFARLWRSHPLNNAEQAPCRVPKDSPTGLLRGTPAYHNQCAIRMGVCLHGAGVTIDQMGRVATCEFHPREEMHCLNAQQTADAIGNLKLPGMHPIEKIIGPDVDNFYDRLFGRRGIVFFKDYWTRTLEVKGPNGMESVKEKAPTGDHIDVWNGYRTSAAWLMEWFSWLGYYHTYGAAREIWFWDVA